MGKTLELFNKWKQRYPGKQILTDGILNEEKWKNSNRKLLFILKENYVDLEEFNYSSAAAYRKWAEGGAMNKRIFKNLYAISFAVQQPSHSFNGSDEDWDLARNYFLESAVINIKKTQGKSKSDDKELRKLSDDDGLLLVEQIDLLTPEIVVCGGTMRYVSNFCNLENYSNTEYIKTYNNTFFLDLYHPSYPKEDEYNHIGFVQELMSQIAK